ncbi:MAG: hypothetical protein HY053_05995 [Proteobacteria bacterium]|nr:hypothetical protein [Pseudomonadota bacterium]
MSNPQDSSPPGRMSFLMWADALFDGRPPMPRIVYTGQEARGVLRAGLHPVRQR